MKFFTLISILLISISLHAQQRIDGSFAFQSDPAKKYSLYIPSQYDVNTPNRLMLGLHPFNTSRWDAESWCDTLINFAETNGLILVCPDGGIDGRVDDSIDTAFTSALLDSVEIWYSIDVQKIYAMGFSWGGKTTYTYGLSNTGRISGFIPIGAAINGASEVNGIISNSQEYPWYVVHGSNDVVNTRYTPLVNALTQNGAILNTRLLNGVGHTIDFTDRNLILSDAYQWVDSVNCSKIDTTISDTTTTGLLEYGFERNQMKIYPNPINQNSSLTLQHQQIDWSAANVRIMNILGEDIPYKTLAISKGRMELYPYNMKSGFYFTQICQEKDCEVYRILMQ